MELHNNAETGTTGSKVETYAGYVNTAINLGTGLFEGIRNKAKAKTAKAIADQGGYNTLSPFQKMLLAKYYPDEFIPESTTPNTTTGKDASGAALTKSNFKKWLPYIIGAVVLGIVVWLIAKKTK